MPEQEEAQTGPAVEQAGEGVGPEGVVAESVGVGTSMTRDMHKFRLIFSNRRLRPWRPSPGASCKALDLMPARSWLLESV